MHTNRQTPTKRGPSSQAMVAVGIGATASAIVFHAFLGGAEDPHTYAVIVVDASLTSRADTRCDDVARIARRIVAKADGDTNVLLMETGDRHSGGQPVIVGNIVIPRSARVMEGADAEVAMRAAGIDEIRKSCERIQPSRESPIFSAALASVRTLASNGCDQAGTRCEMWFRTDGIEEADTVVKNALRRQRREPGTPRIDNASVNVHFCGLAERRTHGPEIDNIRRAFAAEFTRPELVDFEPQCVPFEQASVR